VSLHRTEHRVGPLGGALREDVHLVETSDGVRLALAEVSRADARPPPAQRPAFLLLHGFAQNRRGFTLGPMPEVLLDRGARVFLGELRGHGESRVDGPLGWSLATHLEYDCPALIEGVLRLAQVERVHWIGHSMGGLLGCALLAGAQPLASLTAVATPLVLGAARPLVRLASFLVGPLATIAPKGHRVPMQHLLGALSGPLSAPGARGPLWLLQRLTRLANPEAAAPEALRQVLASADPESPAVAEELARNAVWLQPQIAGVDLLAAVRGARMPVVAVVGSADIFAPREAVAPLEEEGHAGPRRIVEIEGGSHIDAILGHHVPATLAAIWEFLMDGGEPKPPRIPGPEAVSSTPLGFASLRATAARPRALTRSGGSPGRASP
jgi:pimeloyl-ACP methyl ester carboxylesterase